MFLTASNLAHYLLTRDLIDPRRLMRGRFRIVEMGQRNRNFKITLGTQTGLFIKQVKIANAAFIEGLQVEMESYQFARNHPKWAATMPRLLDYDSRRVCLCLELHSDSENLSEYLHREGRMPIFIANQLGRAVAACHTVFRDCLQEIPEAFQKRKKIPWILEFQEAPPGATGGAIAFLKFVCEQSTLSKSMKRVADGWHCDGMIHGDLKWDNCVIFRDEPGLSQLHIVDWELCDIGDSRWDVGGVLQAFLTHQLLHHKIEADATSDQVFVKVCELLLAERPAVDALLQGYLEVCSVDQSSTGDFFLECMQFAAARLVLSAFEWTCHGESLHPQAKTLLLLAQKMMAEPRRAMLELFGNPLGVLK